MTSVDQSVELDPNEPLDQDKRREVESAFVAVRSVGSLGYTETNAYPIHQDLYRRFAMGLTGRNVYGATGWHTGSEEEGTEGTFYAVTDDFLIGVNSSEPGRAQRFSREGPLVDFVGPILTPLSRLKSLEVTRLEFDAHGVPDLDFKAHFEGLNGPVSFERELCANSEMRRGLYYRLRSILAEQN